MASVYRTPAIVLIVAASRNYFSKLFPVDYLLATISRRLFPQEILPTLPRFLTCFLVRIICVRRFACAHEAVSGAVIDHWLELFPRRIHLRRGVRKRGINPRIVASIKSVDRSFDPGHGIFVRGRAIEDKSRGQVRAIGGEAESLPAAPAEASHKQLAIGRGKLVAVVGNGVEVGCDLVRIQMAHRFRHLVLRKVGGTATVRTHSREQVWSDSDIAGCGYLVGKILDPIRHAKDFVDQNYYRPLILRLGINHERFNRTAVMLDRDPFAMSRRFFQLGARPVLSPNRLREQKN